MDNILDLSGSSWQRDRLPPFARLAPDALFGIQRIVRRTSPSGEFGIPLNHPRFLEWVGVGRPVRDGTWAVAQRAVTRSGYGCSHTVTSGRLLNDHESGCPGSICFLTAGHSIKYAAAGPRFQ